MGKTVYNSLRNLPRFGRHHLFPIHDQPRLHLPPANDHLLPLLGDLQEVREELRAFYEDAQQRGAADDSIQHELEARINRRRRPKYAEQRPAQPLSVPVSARALRGFGLNRYDGHSVRCRSGEILRCQGQTPRHRSGRRHSRRSFPRTGRSGTVTGPANAGRDVRGHCPAPETRSHHRLLAPISPRERLSHPPWRLRE